MRTVTTILMALTLLAAAASVQAEDKAASFDKADAIGGWDIKGDVSVDMATSRGEGGGSLKAAPGGMATWRLRDTDGAGKVDLWFHEDGTTRADEKKHGNGPLYGIITKDGRVLTVGAVYAPYVTGNTTYAISEFEPAKNERPWYGLTYVGLR